MKRLNCDSFEQPLSDQTAIAEDGTEYVELIEDNAYVEVPDRISYGSPPFLMKFTQVDLVNDLIAVHHGLLAREGVVNIVLVTNLKEQVEPTNVIFISDRIAHVSLKGYTPITDTWMVRAS